MNGILLNDSDLKIDVKRDSSGLITSGLVVSNINYQRVRLIVEMQKGEFKEFPTLGFGIDNWLRKSEVGNIRQKFVNELEKELRSDNMKTAKVILGNDLSNFKVNL
jgi:hypothetical protein